MLALMMSATSVMRPSAAGTNDDTGLADSHFAITSANSADCHCSFSALGFADDFMAEAKSLTAAANSSSSIVYFMGSPVGNGCVETSMINPAGLPAPFTHTTPNQTGAARLSRGATFAAVDAPGLTSHRSACRPAGWCGFLSFDVLHAANHRFFCPFEPLNSSQQC